MVLVVLMVLVVDWSSQRGSNGIAHNNAVKSGEGILSLAGSSMGKLDSFSFQTDFSATGVHAAGGQRPYLWVRDSG
jgi:hypothetical protein